MSTRATATAVAESAAFENPAPGQKTVNITIDDLKHAKDSNYSLCFAKKIKEGDYNVVWQSYDEYMKLVQFSWIPVYQLFVTNEFAASVQVKVTSDPETLELGQQCVLDQEGDLNPATDVQNPDKPTSLGLTLVNNFGDVHPGVNQQSTGIDGTVSITPIYVSVDPVLKGSTLLTPVEKVLIWLEQGAQTSAMFSDSKSRQIEVDMTERESINLEFRKDETWVIV